MITTTIIITLIGIILIFFLIISLKKKNKELDEIIKEKELKIKLEQLETTHQEILDEQNRKKKEDAKNTLERLLKKNDWQRKQIETQILILKDNENT